MFTIKKNCFILLATALTALPALAQNDGKGVKIHGSVQTEFLVPETDEKIGTGNPTDKLQNKTYVDASLNSKYVDAGVRFEYLEHPLPGYEPDFKGWGVPNFYARGKFKNIELTIGDCYEQFGSGFILRTYEERSLGVDNSIRGGKLKINAIPGVRFTAIGGVQRTYWSWNTNSKIFGADAEIEMSTIIPAIGSKGANWIIGGSWVLKNEKKPSADESVLILGNESVYHLNVPENVNAFDLRTQFNKGGFSILAEYAQKSEDPSHDNGYTFNKGNVAMLSASYSKSGFAALVQAKRSEDMSFRSQRSKVGIPGFLNHMPAFAYQHTYALAALYPYATQYCNISETGNPLIPGEWALQGEFAYTFKRKTALGGKYGTKIKLNISHARGLDAKINAGSTLPDGSSTDLTYGSKGYTASFFGMGDCYYQDINIQLEKKFTKDFKLNFMYMNQIYNQVIIEGEGAKRKSNIFVADARYQFSRNLTLRAEAQYLIAGGEGNMEEENRSGDWAYALLELTVLPHFMFTISDQYGKPFYKHSYHDKEHYFMGMVTFTHGAHRVMGGYGRTRAGYNCSGGVCRWVPASKGFQLSYNYTF